MPMFRDRIVFITGASAGIGAACAEAFAAEGASLLLCARRLERLQPVGLTLSSRYGVPVHVFALDVTRAEDVEATLADLPGEWRPVDILVNNAGKALGRDSVLDARVDHLEGMIDANVRGLLHVTRAIVPGMVARGRGQVINVGSTAGKWVYPGGAVYCATKAAVATLTEGLKMDLHGTPIRVGSVDPGLVETEFSLVRFEGDEEKARAVYADMTPLTARDVAQTVLFMASRPPHVNISQVVMLPTDQSSSSMVHRHRKPEPAP